MWRWLVASALAGDRVDVAYVTVVTSIGHTVAAPTSWQESVAAGAVAAGHVVTDDQPAYCVRVRVLGLRRAGGQAEVALQAELVHPASKRTLYIGKMHVLVEAADQPDEAVVQDALRQVFAVLEARDASRDVLAPAPARFDVPVTVAGCSAEPLRQPQGIARAAEAVVTIETEEGHGTGTIISPDGWVLTAAHVVDGVTAAEVRAPGSASFPAQVVRLHRDHDLALLKMGGERLPCLKLSTALPDLGADLFAIGAPLSTDLSHSVTKGIVSGVRTSSLTRRIQTDTPVNSGNSGGPLLTSDGLVSGVVVSKLVGATVEGVAFATPAADVADALGLMVGGASTTDLATVAGQVGGASGCARRGSRRRDAHARGRAPIGGPPGQLLRGTGAAHAGGARPGWGRRECACNSLYHRVHASPAPGGGLAFAHAVGGTRR